LKRRNTLANRVKCHGNVFNCQEEHTGKKKLAPAPKPKPQLEKKKGLFNRVKSFFV
jgi:hypothetical protein